MIDQDPVTLTRKQLRQFGLVMAAAIALVFGVVFPWLRSHPAPPWIWGLAAAFACLGIIAPRLLAPVYTTWMKIGGVLGWVNTRIILGMVFYGVATPMALVMRLLKYDPMQRTLDTESTSYRVVRDNPAIDMEKPY